LWAAQWSSTTWICLPGKSACRPGLGMPLADRGRPVVATMGDGSFIFANPVAGHEIAEILTLLFAALNDAE
jgi:thiamine pyrophosphate-dependent acetolactate synthase large subunit-like protein